MQDQHLGVGVVVISHDGKKVLLGKRKNSYKSGFYGLPGGRVELSEKLVVYGRRELLEETGLEINDLEYLGVVRDFQDGFTFTHFAYLCKNFEGEPKNIEPEKCEGWEWFDLDSVPDNTLPGHKAAIDIYLNPGETNLRDIITPS